MTRDDIRSVLAALAGYWPTPALTEEEVIAWTTELAGGYKTDRPEVMRVIQSEASRQWRPRPGEMVELIQHYRRQDALRQPRPALTEGGWCSIDRNLEGIAHCRELLTAGRAARGAE